MFRPLFQIFLL